MKNKKQTLAWENSTLEGFARPFYSKGSLPKVDIQNDLPDWQIKGVEDALPILDVDMSLCEFRPAFITLDAIYCPKCGKGEATTGIKSKVATFGSNVKCKRCLLTNASKSWLCSCEAPWPKCVIHRKPAAKQRTEPMRKTEEAGFVTQIRYGQAFTKA